MRHCTQCGASTPDDARFCPRCGSAVAAASGDPMLGKVIVDRYLLVEKIGQGGSGTIYRGEHTTLRKRVAVKVLHAQLSTDDTALERFRREATTVAELDNEHILQVLDFGRAEDGRLFFAMEYLEGETLTKVLEREKRLPIARAVDILTQIAEALMEAHGLGYVHRDLRPRNIFLINKRGRADFVKLLDFGLAKLVLPNVEAKQTAMGMTFGDPRYMSPEQARGEPLDRRSDIYSLGAIAYEMLTGAPPFVGSGTFEILQQHLDAPVARVRDRRPDCPEWLESLVLRALAKRPDGRFVTVLKLIECVRAHATTPAGSTPEEQAVKPSSARSSVEAPVTKSARETQALTSLAMKPPQSASPPARADKPADRTERPQEQALPEKQAEAGGEGGDLGKAGKEAAAETAAAETAKAGAGVAAAASGSLVVTPASSRPALAVDVPSVVVDSASHERATGAAADAAPLPPPPAVEPPRKRERPPTGEWFSSDSQPLAVIPGAAAYEDLDDELPQRNRGPVIIAAVAGGLTLVGAVVIALLPKPQHKPLRGETAAQTTQAPDRSAQPPTGEAKNAAVPPADQPAIGTVAAAPPTSPSAAPTGTAGSGSPQPPPGGEAPAPAPATAAAAKPGAATAQPATGAPAVAAAPASPSATKPVAVSPPPAAKPAAISPPPVAVSPPPAAKPAAAVAPATKDSPAHGERPKPERATRVAATERPAAADKRKREAADAVRDPYAQPPKISSTNESAQAEFFIKLGRQKLGSSDLTAAAANFNKAREYDARSAEAIAGLGEVAFEQGDYAGAAVHLKQALKLAPNRSRYLVLLGQSYYKLGRAKDAVGEYKKALRIDPTNQEAQRSLEVAERKLQSGG